MRVYWTLTPSRGGFNVGLFATFDHAQAVVDRHELGHQEMAAAPIYAASVPDTLADQLAGLGVAEDVLEGFDGSVAACHRLATALSNVGFGDRSEAEREITLSAAGRLCWWCGRVARVAGYTAGDPRLACSRHADELDRESGLGGGQ